MSSADSGSSAHGADAERMRRSVLNVQEIAQLD
jgi:hypothetical protein